MHGRGGRREVRYVRVVNSVWRRGEGVASKDHLRKVESPEGEK